MHRRGWRPRLLEWGAVFGGSFLLATAITWPLLKRIKSGMYGFGNDNYAGAWQAEWIHDAAWGPERTGFTHRLQAPFGMEFDDRFVQPLDRILAILFGNIADGLFAMNIQIFASFVLAGPTMYLLVRHLTRSRPAAAVAAVIFMASPFHLAMAMQYQALSTIQWHPLLVLAFLVALETRRYLHAVLFGAAFALVWFSSYYYGWFGLWFLLAMLVAAGVAGLIRAARARRVAAAVRDAAAFLVTRGSVAAGTFLVLTAPLIARLAFRVASDTGAYSRSVDDLYQNAVKPWQYVLPPHDNPFFGRFTRDFIQTHLGILPVYEQSVYLGFVAVVLAILAFIAWSRLRPEGRLAAPMLAVGGAFMVLLSLGSELPLNPFSIQAWMDRASVPNVTNVSVYIFDLLPTFRYYGRTFAWTSVALAALAGMGFAVLASRFARRSPLLPWAVAAVAIGLVLVEFTNAPPFRWLDLTKRPWIRAVEQLPEQGPIVDYPLQDFYGPRSAYYIFAQAQHDRPTLNPAADPAGKELSFAVADPDNPEAGRRLHEAGFRYAVIHTNLIPRQTFPPYQPAYPDDSLSPNAGAQNPWFERVKLVEDAIIYRIRSRPRPAQPTAAAAYGSGFGTEESDGFERWRWMNGSASTLPLYVSGSPRPFHVSFRVASFHVPRVMTVFVDGRPVRRVTVRPDVLTDVTVPAVLGAGAHDVRLVSDPGPESINNFLHNGDLRSVGLRISPPTIRESPSAAVAEFGAGFGTNEVILGEDWRWIIGDRGALAITVAGARRPLELAFDATAFAKPRLLSVRVDGRRRAVVRVPVGRAHRVTLPLVLGPGTHIVQMRSSPPAVAADEVLGNGDQRRLSVRLRSPVVSEATASRTGPASDTVRFGRGFSFLERDGEGTWRWLTSRDGTFTIRATGPRQSRVLDFAAGSLGEIRRLDVAVDGREVLRTQVPAIRPQDFRLPLELGAGSHVVRLSVRPGPRQINDVVRDSPDRRTVSIRVRTPTLEPKLSPPAAFASTAFGYGFATPVSDDRPGWRWLSGREGTLNVSVTGRPRPLRLTFRAQSWSDRPRRLTIAMDGRTLASRTVRSARAVPFELRLPARTGTYALQLRTEPGSVFHGDRPFHPDPRKVSVSISPVVTRAARPR
jgi:hypothetical protein